MENENGEIIPIGTGNNVVETTDDIIALAERRLEKIQKLKTIALKSTNAHDWTDVSGKPYLNSSGAEKIARLFGVKISNVHSEKVITEDEKGKFYYYLVRGVSSLSGGIDSIEAIGTCSSKDQFFAKRGGEMKLLSEIDETNIMKAAYSNFMGNAITRLLGIRNLTWEQIDAAGVDRKKIAKVEYQKGSQGGAQSSVSMATVKQINYIKAMLKKEHIEEGAFLKEMGIDSFEKILFNSVNDILTWITNNSQKAPEDTKPEGASK